MPDLFVYLPKNGCLKFLLLWVILPGPAILAVVGRSLTVGFRSSLKLIIGILLGDVFYLSIVLIGMAAIGKILGDLFIIVGMLGAFYLIYLGLRLWLSNPELNHAVSTNGKPDGCKSYLAGFSITLGNPKVILFHLGFLPTFFDLPALNAFEALLIVLIFTCVLGGSLLMYSFAASKIRLFFRDPRKVRFLYRSAGTILIGAGVAVATRR